MDLFPVSLALGEGVRGFSRSAATKIAPAEEWKLRIVADVLDQLAYTVQTIALIYRTFNSIDPLPSQDATCQLVELLPHL
jgi:hypothetical protein